MRWTKKNNLKQKCANIDLTPRIILWSSKISLTFKPSACMQTSSISFPALTDVFAQAMILCVSLALLGCLFQREVSFYLCEGKRLTHWGRIASNDRDSIDEELFLYEPLTDGWVFNSVMDPRLGSGSFLSWNLRGNKYADQKWTPSNTETINFCSTSARTIEERSQDIKKV